MEGGCFCGEIRYHVEGEPRLVSHCHCIDCRRSSGAAFVTWAELERKQLRLMAGTPGHRVHPADVERTFCTSCGTSLTFRRSNQDTIDITVASLDHPEALQPSTHRWCVRQLPWLSFDDGLPRHQRHRKGAV